MYNFSQLNAISIPEARYYLESHDYDADKYACRKLSRAAVLAVLVEAFPVDTLVAVAAAFQAACIAPLFPLSLKCCPVSTDCAGLFLAPGPCRAYEDLALDNNWERSQARAAAEAAAPAPSTTAAAGDFPPAGDVPPIFEEVIADDARQSLTGGTLRRRRITAE